jgi:hypothetical protein
MIVTPDVETACASWRATSLDTLVQDLRLPALTGRPVVVAVDGRSAGGKSTLAGRLAERMPGSALIHTDDVAWWESFFGWDALMIERVLAPVHRGEGVWFRPPAWVAREREGAIVVPVDARIVIVEGVGASRRSLAHLVDRAVWVQSDYAEAHRRGIDRDVLAGRTQREAEDFWAEWMAAEGPFLADDQPWARADMIACGTPSLCGVAYDPATEVLVSQS